MYRQVRLMYLSKPARLWQQRQAAWTMDIGQIAVAESRKEKTAAKKQSSKGTVLNSRVDLDSHRKREHRSWHKDQDKEEQSKIEATEAQGKKQQESQIAVTSIRGLWNEQPAQIH